MSSKPKTPLQKYLSRKLSPYRRGDADCVAFVAGWVNVLYPDWPITLTPKTFGTVLRSLKSEPLAEQVQKRLSPRGFKLTNKPGTGDVVIFAHKESLGGESVGIYSGGKIISRIEGEKLFIAAEPEILKAWTFSK